MKNIGLRIFIILFGFSLFTSCTNFQDDKRNEPLTTVTESGERNNLSPSPTQSLPPGALASIKELPVLDISQLKTELSFENFEYKSDAKGETLLIAYRASFKDNYTVYMISEPNSIQVNNNLMLLQKFQLSEEDIGNFAKGNVISFEPINASYYYEIESFYMKSKLAVSLANHKSKSNLNSPFDITEDISLLVIQYNHIKDPPVPELYYFDKNEDSEAFLSIVDASNEMDNRYFSVSN